ncbi:MAG: ATP-binding cassette domain-containing protein [Paraburkholderia sp.]|jgi:polar amino acid transport system ATP-binding protein
MSLSARAASSATPIAAATPETVLQLSGVTKRFNGHTVLDSVNLNVTAGETVCLLGPSGSGKSTLLRCINWLEAPDEGSVRLLGQRVGVRADGRRMSDRELASIRTQPDAFFSNPQSERARSFLANYTTRLPFLHEHPEIIEPSS